jgi:polar amino acid transport system substrate-binding protein
MDLTRRAILHGLPAILLASPGTRTYIVGTTATGVPFSFLDLKTNQPAGAMIDIVKAIAADAGFPVEIRVTSFSALIPSLTARKIDLISAGMLKTPAREKVVAFSQPVFSYGAGLVVLSSDKKEYRTIADLKGIAVGVQVGTRFYDQLQASGAHEIRTYDNLMDMLMDLSTRRIEAAYGDAPIFAYQMAQSHMHAARLAQSFHPPSIEDVCLVLRKDDPVLLDRINASITRIQPTHIRAILEHWSLT